MPLPIRLLSILGAIGTLLCVVGIVGVWYVERRIDRAREQVFERVDQSLSAIHGRLVEVQKLSTRSKITIDEIQQRMRDSIKDESTDRLATRFDVEARIQRLTEALRRAEAKLEVSRESVERVRLALEMGDELGLSLNSKSVEPLLERIAAINEDVIQAITMAESFRERIAAEDDDATQQKRMEQVTTLAARLLVTFGAVDSRLAAFQDRLVDFRDTIAQLNLKTRSRIVAVAVCATLFLLWMAAGQFCLWRWARSTESIARA